MRQTCTARHAAPCLLLTHERAQTRAHTHTLTWTRKQNTPSCMHALLQT